MRLIEVLGTVLCLSLAVATGTVGNWELASFLASLPIAYWIIHTALHAKRRKQEADKVKKQMIEDEYQRIRKEREARMERDRLQTPSQAQNAYNQQVLAAQQRHHMRALAAQQAQMQAVQNHRYGYGYSDPRSSFNAQQQPDNSFMNAMMGAMFADAVTSGVGIARTRQDDTGSVVVEHVPVREVYRSADPEPERSSSSSSSYSSDTSSDSFSSSDTGSDSF